MLPITKMYKRWTQSAIECYESNSDCANCSTYKMFETECKMKYTIPILLQELGKPNENNTYLSPKWKGKKVMKLNIVAENPRYLPEYGNSTDFCMDIKVKIPNRYKILKPNETAIFDTGIKVDIPNDHWMLIFSRSSLGFKLNCELANSVGVIDPRYKDEIKLAIHNFSNQSVELQDGQRVAQFAILPKLLIDLNIVKDDANFRKNNRGGGIGSTGI